MKDKTSTKDLSLTSNERIFLEVKSIFRPKKYKNFDPQGLKIYTFNSGFKKKYKDLLIIIFDNLVNNYCVYSKTSTPSFETSSQTISSDTVFAIGCSLMMSSKESVLAQVSLALFSILT